MSELIEEHKYGRQLVSELLSAKNEYVGGNQKSISIILDKLNAIVAFYPDHIEKEDKVFFPDTEKYFSEKEQRDMLDKFWEFDRKMIHEKYEKVVEQTVKKLYK